MANESPKLLTVAKLRKMLEGKPDDAHIAIQSGGSPEFANLLDTNEDDVQLQDNGTTLVLGQSGEAGYVEVEFEDPDEV